ncbi:MAG: DUF167 domain-containing protein [Candidatus Shapirobacteria bacterium]|jgi:hypothetical protein|nr:DUF167 domain-containing protein [Candidatus Shapirobacteria bacterium]
MKIEVVVHPNSKNPRVEKDLIGMIHVYVTAPPLEGKANKAVVVSLSKFLKVKKSGIILIKGEKSRNKVFKVF